MNTKGCQEIGEIEQKNINVFGMALFSCMQVTTLNHHHRQTHLFFFFRIIALQRHVGFSCTTT